MTTTTHGPHRRRPDIPSGSNGNGKVHAPAVHAPRRRVRLPELAVGLLVTVLFALGAVLWHLSATSKMPALAAANKVGRGHVIEAGDLRVVYISTDDALARMTAAESSMIVGRVALVDLAPGTLITPSVVADTKALGPGDGVVGLALDPGQYPGLGLAPGDRVDVVRSGEAAPSGDGDQDTRVLTRGATVHKVEDLAGDRKLVSILMTDGDADGVAAAAGAGGLRLVLVAP